LVIAAGWKSSSNYVDWEDDVEPGVDDFARIAQVLQKVLVVAQHVFINFIQESSNHPNARHK
jgi:hypothetical protein